MDEAYPRRGKCIVCGEIVELHGVKPWDIVTPEHIFDLLFCPDCEASLASIVKQGKSGTAKITERRKQWI